MALTNIFCCCADCGVNATGTSVLSTNGRHVSTKGAGCTNVLATDPTGPDMPGTRTWKFLVAGGISDTWAHLFPVALTTGESMVVRFKIQFRDLPNAIKTIVSNQAGLNGIRYNPTGTKLEAWAGAATATFAGAFTVTTGVIYEVECRFDRRTTHVTSWKVGGDAQTAASKAGQTAATQTGFNLGHNATGSGGSAAATATYYITDICVAKEPNADGPTWIGSGTGRALYPNRDGVHQFTNGDFDVDGGAQPNNNATDIWTHLHSAAGDGLSSTIGVYVGQRVDVNTPAAHTARVHFGYDSMPAAAVVNGVEIVSETHGSTTGAHTFSLGLWSDDNFSQWADGVLYLVDSSDLTVSYNSKHYATRPTIGGVWTKPDVDALVSVFGDSTDVIGNPRLDGVCLEVDYVPLPSGPTFKRRNRSDRALTLVGGF